MKNYMEFSDKLDKEARYFDIEDELQNPTLTQEEQQKLIDEQNALYDELKEDDKKRTQW